MLPGRPIALELGALQAKMVSGGRGGYCFEHGTLVFAMIEAIGFRPRPHLARVTVSRARHEAPRTHMLVTVPVSADVFVVDVGFGAYVPRQPVPLSGGAPPAGDRDAHWMAATGDGRTLRARRDGTVVDGWVSALDHETPENFQVANHYTSASARSEFVRRIVAHAVPHTRALRAEDTMSKRVMAPYAVTAGVMLVLDAIWLGLVATAWYRDALGALMTDSPRWLPALLFYLGYPAGLVAWAILPRAATPGLRGAALHGAALGLFAYGTYDLTAMAVIRDWPIGISVLDMAWGATASALSAAAGKAWIDRSARV